MTRRLGGATVGVGKVAGAAVAALLALAAIAPAASAHGGRSQDYDSVMRSVGLADAGVQLEVLDGDDRLELRNRTGKTVVVEGYDGEPYARLSPDGKVEVNRNSPALYLNRDRLARVDVPDYATGDAAPRWRTLNRSGRFEWHDHRIHWMGTEAPEQVTDEGQRTKIYDWRVPYSVGDRKGEATGTLFWRGRPGQSFPVAAAVALGAVLIGGVALVVVVRRRRRRPDRPVAEPGREAW